MREKQPTAQSDQYLTIKNYKEPLKKAVDGYGYLGALSVSIDGERVQCHQCGGLFRNLGPHIRHIHKTTVTDYRKKYQLSPTTALLSESEREARKQALLKWMAELSPEKLADMRKRAKEGWRKWYKEAKRSGEFNRFKITLEKKNERGTCPDQLLEKIKQVKEKLGHTPSVQEFIIETGGQRYKHLIFTTFGSWKNALKILGLEPKEKVENGGRHYQWTKEALIDALQVFAQEHRTIPTATDCKRDVLPDWKLFKRHFGSFEQARVEAGIYKLPWISPIKSRVGIKYFVKQ